jgi:hypothetical protein
LKEQEGNKITGYTTLWHFSPVQKLSAAQGRPSSIQFLREFTLINLSANKSSNQTAKMFTMGL